MSGGGSLGLGKQKSDASSQQTSSAYGFTQAESGDSSQSLSNSVGGGQSSAGQSVFESDIFAQLFGNASGAAAKAAANAPELAGIAKQLFTGGAGFMESLGGDAGSEYMRNRLSSDNPVLDEQISGLSTDIGKLFNEQLMPGIRSTAAAGGTLGGGRQGVAEGLATRAAAEQFTKGVTALRANDVNQRDQIAAGIATNSLQSAATGLGALPTLLDISERGANQELGVYSTLAGILGGPTTLSSSQSTDFSRSTAESVAQAFSKSFGQQTSTSQGTSTSRGRGWNFDMSGYGGVAASGGE
jgi:hypothetical protein